MKGMKAAKTRIGRAMFGAPGDEPMMPPPPARKGKGNGNPFAKGMSAAVKGGNPFAAMKGKKKGGKKC